MLFFISANMRFYYSFGWLGGAHPVFRSQKSRLLLSGEHDYRP